ncbi:DMT family transporter [Nocardioides pocheonensis]|nr:DMT family transporter [Nocardioides pocheonensis]
MRGGTLALLGVGVLAVSLAAPLMASLAVPALPIAFWRNALASVAIAPVAGWRAAHPRPATPGAPAAGPRDLVLVGVAGLCLASHFGFWVTSLGMTSVASSTAIVSLQVIWVVGYDLARGAPVGRRVVLGVLLATAGAVVVGGVDLSISARALAGDGLALVGSLGVAAYAVIGGRARQRLPTSTYTLGCYGTAAAALLVAAVVAGQPLTGYAQDQWLKLLLLTATAQLLGHSVFNHLLATVSPMVVSLTILLEIPGASLIAAAWLGQVPEATAFVGLAMILAGMALVVLAAPPSGEAEAVAA